MAWQLPPADIRARNQANLAAMGVSQSTNDALLNNTDLHADFGARLRRSAEGAGRQGRRRQLHAAGGEAATETEARFYINQLRMAGVYKKSERIEKLDVAGKSV